MKTIRIFIAIAIAVLSTQGLKAQDHKLNLFNFEPKAQKATIKVYGECDMCKRRIEKALKIEGIKSSYWDVDTKILTVLYHKKKIDIGKISSLVAAAGHDTDKVKAKDEVYNAFPDCCQYERAPDNSPSEVTK
ncbi:heavy-metal-associated domain-containing protein [Chitinophaga niabensis]|uniref:Copper chaperone CopZ n=1 Tax=Chitinophaga niabensis TaxID=536979 RepID=A0A1N6DC05_9BACT|nr:heavy-metal-associated domain-containing protein [Chitinophaga niabensis]SIN68184.1 Copper chaperone CopZ [Chitinophaga niabensis]